MWEDSYSRICGYFKLFIKQLRNIVNKMNKRRGSCRHLSLHYNIFRILGDKIKWHKLLFKKDFNNKDKRNEHNTNIKTIYLPFLLEVKIDLVVVKEVLE